MLLESEFTPENVNKLLSEGIITVTFGKMDGTERVMRCTLNPNYIPLDKMPKTNKDKDPGSNTIPVWDMDVEGWRSFRVDSIITIDK
jgi:hypothetical protein